MNLDFNMAMHMPSLAFPRINDMLESKEDELSMHDLFNFEGIADDTEKNVDHSAKFDLKNTSFKQSELGDYQPAEEYFSPHHQGIDPTTALIHSLPQLM